MDGTCRVHKTPPHYHITHSIQYMHALTPPTFPIPAETGRDYKSVQEISASSSRPRSTITPLSGIMAASWLLPLQVECPGALSRWNQDFLEGPSMLGRRPMHELPVTLPEPELDHRDTAGRWEVLTRALFERETHSTGEDTVPFLESTRDRIGISPSELDQPPWKCCPQAAQAAHNEGFPRDHATSS
jgi:hypothetical protein